MITTANTDYMLKYSLLTVDMTPKKLKKASIKYLLHILNPDISSIEIFGNHYTVSKITLDGVMVMFSQGLNTIKAQMPLNYQIDEVSIIEIHYTTMIGEQWELCAGNSIPSLKDYYDFPVHEVKLIAHREGDYKLQDVQMLDITPIPQKFIYHYARSNQGQNIILG